VIVTKSTQEFFIEVERQGLRMANLDGAGEEMAEQHEKLPFVWEEPQPLVQVPKRLIFRSLPEVGMEAFVTAVGRAMVGSLDQSDQKKVRELGVAQAAAHFLTEVTDYFEYQPQWWQLGYDQQGNLVGFVQPVIYPGCSKDGLEEGTLYYIGVVPEQRGNRYIDDLLLHATSILQRVGVWRIYCDTDVLNQPMIQAFQRAGYQPAGPSYMRPL
jgi:ribosomal protein S18 acetylase RimI-like enzyme